MCGAPRSMLSSAGTFSDGTSSISRITIIVAAIEFDMSSLSVGSTMSVPATGKDIVGAWKP